MAEHVVIIRHWPFCERKKRRKSELEIHQVVNDRRHHWKKSASSIWFVLTCVEIVEIVCASCATVGGGRRDILTRFAINPRCFLCAKLNSRAFWVVRLSVCIRVLYTDTGTIY